MAMIDVSSPEMPINLAGIPTGRLPIRRVLVFLVRLAWGVAVLVTVSAWVYGWRKPIGFYSSTVRFTQTEATLTVSLIMGRRPFSVLFKFYLLLAKNRNDPLSASRNDPLSASDQYS